MTTKAAGAAALTILGALVAAGQYAAASSGPEVPQRLSETGLYVVSGFSAPDELAIDPRNRPFSPQYPLWSDGARKSRWVRMPPGTTIDARDVDRWDFPVGTRFWKESWTVSG